MLFLLNYTTLLLPLICMLIELASGQHHNSSSSKQQQQLQAPSTTAATKAPNYLETSRQITNILDKFMSLGYDKRVRPNYGGPPVEVNVTMRILSISSVSEVMMDFTADFYFRQTWQDPRLAFKRMENIKTLYVGAEVSKKIWLPDTFFGNEKLAYFHEATTPNVFLRIDHSGEVYRSIRLTVTSSCPMNLQYFPMDRQRCTIEAESYGYNVKDIIYRWARKDTAVERDKEISLPQFDIVKTVQKYRLEVLSSGTYSRLIAEIHFARRMGYYLIQIYIPSSLIVVISWVSFWLHRNASPARVQLGVTTVLTMTTLMSSTNAALPKISYVKSIDIFLGTCFVMVFAALLEYATVGYLGKRIAMRKAHLQHAQSQAQTRLFALAQAQGAQGAPVVPVLLPDAEGGGGGAMSSPSGTPNLFGSTAGAAGPALPPLHFLRASEASRAHSCVRAQNHAHPAEADADQPPVPPPRNKCSACAACPPASLASSASQTLPRHITFSHQHYEPDRRRLNNDLDEHHHHPHQSHHLLDHNSRNYKQHAHQHHNHTHNHHHDCNQAGKLDQDAPKTHGCQHVPAASCCRQHHQQASNNNIKSQPLPSDNSNQPPNYHHLLCAASVQQQQLGGGAQPAAAAAAAATFVNLHRRNKGLPPSTNPNFAHHLGPWMGPAYNRALDTIFGIRPSDIDKYSRVVFPVCFVCFQLMYWIVYLHISAFIETGELPTAELQPPATAVHQQQQQQQQPQQLQLSSGQNPYPQQVTMTQPIIL